MKATDISSRAILIIDKVSQDLEQSQDYLTSLDAAIGDGDHGVSMTIAARAVRKRLKGFTNESLSKILVESGKVIQAEVGATVGALYGCALIQAGKALEGVESLSLSDVDQALQAALNAVQTMGMASVGEKTVVDAMVPAVEAVRSSLNRDMSASDAIVDAARAARQGMEATCGMVAVRGRASRLGSRTIGAQDPGATSFYLILKSIAESVQPGLEI